MLAVEKRKLNSIVTSPGMTLVAPVPPLILEICHVVGGKYSLPSSHLVCQFGNGRRGQVDGIFSEVGVGDMALYAFHGQCP